MSGAAEAWAEWKVVPLPHPSSDPCPLAWAQIPAPCRAPDPFASRGLRGGCADLCLCAHGPQHSPGTEAGAAPAVLKIFA